MLSPGNARTPYNINTVDPEGAVKDKVSQGKEAALSKVLWTPSSSRELEVKQ